MVVGSYSPKAYASETPPICYGVFLDDYGRVREQWFVFRLPGGGYRHSYVFYTYASKGTRRVFTTDTVEETTSTNPCN
jgi:hypothetical protein